MVRKTAEQIAERALRAHRIPRKQLQYGAVCYRRTKKGIRVLLITSRRTKRWLCPKGWPMKDKTGPESAAQEAWEEAGVKGKVSDRTLGFYSYPKYISRGKQITCVVQVFPLEVVGRKKKFPEKDERRGKWMAPAKAAKRVAEPELAALIRKLEEYLDA